MSGSPAKFPKVPAHEDGADRDDGNKCCLDYTAIRTEAFRGRKISAELNEPCVQIKLLIDCESRHAKREPEPEPRRQRTPRIAAKGVLPLCFLPAKHDCDHINTCRQPAAASVVVSLEMPDMGWSIQENEGHSVLLL